ncbi:MAG: RNA polymerase sigma factor [bacterium]|nr:RNA polymerase sigma factor [bacterium]
MKTEQEHRQDLTLAERAARGDQAAWREIYNETSDGLFNLLTWQTGDRDTARDLMQETYVKAMKSLEGFRGDGSLGGWLRTIAMRKCLDWRRSLVRQARKRLAVLIESSSTSEAPQLVRFSAEETDFRQALVELSPRQRASLLLREIEEISFAEIGEILGCGEATVRVHYHRAREAMRRILGDAACGAGNDDRVDEMEGMQP